MADVRGFDAAAVAALRASGDGLVVNISSVIALVGLPFCTTYGATEAGIAHFGEALRRELYGEGVRVVTRARRSPGRVSA